MANVPARRAAPLLPALVLGVCACFLAPHLARHAATFAGAPSLRASAVRQQVMRQGFKEEFDSWKSSLTEDELALVTEQASGEFNKAFRKSDQYMKDLPEDKIKSFSTILGKFFENEAEDYKKEEEATKSPDYEGLLKKAGDKKMDFSLKNRVIEVDRDADRRYKFAVQKIAEAKRKGEKFPQSSPMIEKYIVQNDDEKSHEAAVKIIEFIKRAAAAPGLSAEQKKAYDATIAKGVPPVGEPFELPVPQVLVNQLLTLKVMLDRTLAKKEANSTEAEFKTIKEGIPELAGQAIAHLTKKYIAARDEVEHDAMEMKAFFRSQEKYKGDTSRTKADVLKEIWDELPQHTDKPVPPLDDELLAELAEFPATAEGEFMHSWGTADKLYKSEAIDAFGGKYLLGVFETKDEAIKAFDDWNAEYEKSRSTMRDELEQWGKQEQARLDADPEPMERIKKVLEQARR